MKNLSEILSQARALQEKMGEMQARIAALEATGKSGGGMVRITLNGKNELTAIAIDPSLMTSDSREILEDLIVAAHKDAKGKLDEILAGEMSKLTGGLPLPPGFKLPFG